MLAMVQAVFGMFYVTLMIAQLVSLYSSKDSSDGMTSNKSIGSENRQATPKNPNNGRAFPCFRTGSPPRASRAPANVYADPAHNQMYVGNPSQYKGISSSVWPTNLVQDQLATAGGNQV